MRTTPINQEQPWTRPWWQYSEGNGPVLFYLVLVHALALAGLLLFPLPSLPVLAVALGFAAVRQFFALRSGLGTRANFINLQNDLPLPLSGISTHGFLLQGGASVDRG